MTKEEFIYKYGQPAYLGDSVYAWFNGAHVVLETRNGLPTDPSNTIMLESVVLKNLFDYSMQLADDAERLKNNAKELLLEDNHSNGK